MTFGVRAGGRSAPATHPLTVLIAAIWVALAPWSRAWAYDWTVRTGTSQSLRVDDNPGLSVSNKDPVATSSSAANVNAQARSKTDSLNLLGGLGYTLFRGLESDKADRESVSNNLSANFSRKTKRTTVSSAASFRRLSTFFSEEEDTGRTGVSNHRLTYSANAGVSRQLNATNSAGLSASYTRTTFERQSTSLTPYDSYNVSTSLNHKANNTLSTSLTGSVGFFEPRDAPTGSRSTAYRLTTSFQKALSHTLRTNGSVGARIVESDAGTSPVGIPVSFGLSYQGKTSGATLSLSRSVAPSAIGSLQSTTSARVNASHKINQYLNFSIGGAYSLYVAGTESASFKNRDRTAYNLNSSLGYNFAPDWSLSFNYAHRFEERTAGGARSNNVSINLTHSFVPLP